MSRARMVSSAWSGPVTALLVTVALSAISTAGFAKPRDTPESNERCYRDNFDGRRLNGGFDAIPGSELLGIATDCYNKAADRSKPTGQTIYANFYAGKAWRIVGTSQSLPPGDRTWRDAEQALRLVVGFHDPNDSRNPQPLTPRSSPSDLRAELTRIEAEVELAQVLSAQGRRPDAEQLAAKAMAEYGAFNSFPAIAAYPTFAERVNSDSDNASYVRATILRAPPANKTDAVVALYAFLNPRTNKHPRAEEARAALYDMATEVGRGILEQGTREPSTAATYFTAARDAATAAYNVRPTPELALNIADANVNLGQVSLRLASRLGPNAIGGCNPVGDPGRTQGAIKYFGDAQNAATLALSQRPAETRQRLSTALQWQGCAQMAGGDPTSAIESFKQAARSDAGSATTQLALARVLYSEATRDGAINPETFWQSSRDAYASALRIMRATRAPNDKLFDALIESADVDVAYVKNTAVAPRAREAIASAIASLNAAKGMAKTRPEAYLRLGTIYIGDDAFVDSVGRGQFAGVKNPGEARSNLGNALNYALGPEQRAVSAQAHYYLSLLATQRMLDLHRVGGAAQSAAREAISHGDEAAKNADNEHSLLYFRQACEARLLSVIPDERGEQYCRADDTRDQDTDKQRNNYAEALLRQGMYFLSRGSNSRKNQSAQWDAATAAFDLGASRLPPFTTLTQDDATAELLAKLLAGKGLAMKCSGLTNVGEAIIRGIPAGPNAKAEYYFRTKYDLPRC